jgi:hypothetical protein
LQNEAAGCQHNGALLQNGFAERKVFVEWSARMVLQNGFVALSGYRPAAQAAACHETAHTARQAIQAPNVTWWRKSLLFLNLQSTGQHSH